MVYPKLSISGIGKGLYIYPMPIPSFWAKHCLLTVKMLYCVVYSNFIRLLLFFI